MNKENRYTKMQSSYYESDASLWTLEYRDPVVGSFDAHNDWDDYKYLFIDFENLHEKICLDFACGPGRNLVKYQKDFKRIDGVDLAENNLSNARIWIDHNYEGSESKLIKCNGVDLENIEDNTYDIVMSTIAMQHICVHEIRYNYLSEFYRILKPEGWITIQMGFGSPSPATVGYYENNYDATGTNRACDTEIANEDQIKNDLLKIGYDNFKAFIRPCGPGDGHPNWIFFRAQKN